MRNTGLALGLVALAATACLAETPELSGGRQSGPLMTRGRLFNGQNWWTRFGEPVNAAALAADDGAKGDVVPVAMYGHDYVYGPGACECPPPCIDQLWTGYNQHPKRCDGYVPLFHRHCGHCGDCGDCGHGRLFGHGKHCGCGEAIGCTTKAACDCPAPITCTSVPDCGCAKPHCGCKHFHLGHKWKGFMAHWNRCDSCSAPIGCGCATPLAPGIPFPNEKQALTQPQPLPEDAALITLPRLQ